MRNITILIFLSFLFSCKKNESRTDEITYEVILINSPAWHGSYLNERAEVVGVVDGHSGWKYSFLNKNNLTVATLDAYSDGVNLDSDAIMNIYLNSKLVASGKSSLFPQVQYIFP